MADWRPALRRRGYTAHATSAAVESALARALSPGFRRAPVDPRGAGSERRHVACARRRARRVERACGRIAPFAARAGRGVEIDARLRERTLSAPHLDGWLDEVRRSVEEPDRRKPGGESARDVLARGAPLDADRPVIGGAKIPADAPRVLAHAGAMTRKTVLVTGGNSGIGRACAERLARDGWHVVIASRDRAASAEAVRRIAQRAGPDAASEMALDLGSLASVRAFAREIEAKDLPLHALVCNAGLQTGGGLVRSADGFERTFAVNHLGHFLLTNLLLARLSANGPARIAVVASGVHDPAQRTGMPKAAVGDLDVLAATGGAKPDTFDGRLAYVNSKLCNVWFVYELARRLDAAGLAKRITVNGYDPGLVPGSGLARDYPAALRFVWDRILPGVARVATIFVAGISTAEKSGDALARLVTDPAYEGVTGKYYPSTARWREAPSSQESYDETKARALWDASVRMARMAPGESPLALA